MFTADTLTALGKIAVVFAFILLGIARKWGLWPPILAGAGLMGFLCGFSPLAVGAIFAQACVQPRFLAMAGVVAFILLLSEVQAYSGQGRRLVNGLEPYMRSPRLRLIFFPALIGLLPMPGGAIFSCPMVRDIAEGTTLSSEDKGIINYWFRHIWEVTWPLCPGYILACAFADIPISVLWRYTWPLAPASLCIGFFLFLRAPVAFAPGQAPRSAVKKPLPAVLADAMPIVAAIAGAPVFGLIFDMLHSNNLAPEVPFITSLLAAAAIALAQTKTPLSVVPRLLFTQHVMQMLMILFAIFAFKDVIIATKITEMFSPAVSSRAALLGLTLFLSLLCGLLTGLMAGFVGTAFPLLLALLLQMGLYEDRLPWVVLALVAGNLGQMASPVHTCLLVTVDFFQCVFSSFWRRVLKATALQGVAALCYVALLWLSGAKL